MSSKRHLTEAGKRLIRDLKKLKIDPPAGIIAAPAEDNIMNWEGVIIGPSGTPWEGGMLILSLCHGNLLFSHFKAEIELQRDVPQ